MKKSSPFSRVLYHNPDGEYWLDPNTNHEFAPQDYELKINNTNQVLVLKRSTDAYWDSKESMTSATFKECNLLNNKGEPIKIINLLADYAKLNMAIEKHFQKNGSQTPREVAQIWWSMIGKNYNQKLLDKYHNELEQTLKELLHLSDTDVMLSETFQELIEIELCAEKIDSKKKVFKLIDMQLSLVS